MKFSIFKIYSSLNVKSYLIFIFYGRNLFHFDMKNSCQQIKSISWLRADARYEEVPQYNPHKPPLFPRQ